MKDNIYSYLKDKKVLILGFGREGKSTYNLIRFFDKEMIIGIADMKDIEDNEVLNDKNVIIHTGSDYLDYCKDYELIIKGPGTIIKDYLSLDIRKRITCQTDLFMKYCTSKTIGITGTKGKSTTSSLMYHILNKIGKKTVLMGNIGIPCFDVLDDIDEDTLCVIELGVHQLEYMSYSPNISVVLNIYEEHLDHYLSMQHYVDSKKNIYLHQKKDDYVLMGDSPFLNDTSLISNVIKYGNMSNNCFCLTAEKLNIIINNDKLELPISSINTQLKGTHNLYDILVCLTIIKILDFDIEKSVESIASFHGLPHRMEYVGTVNSIMFYDDAIATSIPSVICAVETLGDVDTIIIGGMDRGLDYTPLVEFLNNSEVRNVVLLPATNTRINDLFLETKSDKNIYMVEDMEQAVKISKEKTMFGKICLLSPAAASYGFYKNFEEKGEHFQKLIKE